MELTIDRAERFAAIAFGHVGREYPNALGHVLAGPDDGGTPQALHPMFYGSFDWHSCVHSFWMLARLLRRFPEMSAAATIRALFDERFVPEKVQAECAYLARPLARGFERPYGWGWLLKLAAELHGCSDGRWATTLAPLTEAIVRRFHEFLPLATYAVRSGTHSNTAFALRLAADYAATAGNAPLRRLLVDTATRWYRDDAACPAWGEPGGDDFLSPSLVEAECMHRLFAAEDFASWLERFFPHISEREPKALFVPARVSDRSDGKIAHLDGLNLSRAWCWRSIGTSLSSAPARAVAAAAAMEHLAASLPYVSGDYMGEHWLATYAVLALDDDPAHS
jgi:hypothetical protein